MAVLTDLAQARNWFEANFAEMHVFDRATHPSGLGAGTCPAGSAYLTVTSNGLEVEGYGRHIPMEQVDCVNAWYKAAGHLWEAMGRPTVLWWRTLPEFEPWPIGKIYSRFVMTHG